MPTDMRRRRTFRLLLWGTVAVAASACGFEPLHAPDAQAAGGRGSESRVEVDVIPGAAGFALRERLVERLGAPAAPTYRLLVDLTIREDGAAITDDDITTRFIVAGSAAFRLVPITGGDPVMSGVVTGRTGYSAPVGELASAYATRVAALAAQERVAHTLADRIALRIQASDLTAEVGAAGSRP